MNWKDFTMGTFRELPEDHSLFFDRGLTYLRNVEDSGAAMANIVRSAAAAVGSDSASLYLLKQSTGMLEPLVLVNIAPEYLKGCAAVPLGTQCCGRAALHKIPWAVSDMWEDPLFADCASAARESGLRAAFSIPVMLPDDECIGTLAAHFRRVFEPGLKEIDLLTIFARLISMAVVADIKEQNLSVQDWISARLKQGPRVV